ncbi:DNA mismatch repair protein MutS [Peribacillus butanolivorans]|uniref:DNA mismatch repair protein MutS n=1 Tax=Peribacillus butanolivorans TaxID=421767 RepID=A0AAX0S6X3_9BACI|nr:DNA mismatch repair protein MutS [Peribacillus butanolivorans]AXN40622.1 DNA mismatch repair protein MutS [Peribacillus butanolivorans]KQU18620.1 DNA mismatch repair protein MutS [Bacillus sp. Leaf13]PEJ34984.1 DNA mismatch repair protein MutS [Peribacillus butanolivorans]QNU05493.1 DNA mismatch repair protein MutS [Peribacillus butanolivorans]
MAGYTPMIQQYLKIKAEYQDAFLFFRLGDFYEMFFDDALNASQELEITLTSREGGSEDRIPMCGIPYHSAANYIDILIEKGFKVAICEQTEDPKQAKGVVRREVVQLITPGTKMDSKGLREKENNYIATITHFSNDQFGFGYNDLSTGENKVTLIENFDEVLNEFAILGASEVVIAADFNEEWKKKLQERGAAALSLEDNLEHSESFVPLLHLLKDEKQMTTTSRLLNYLYRTQKRSLDHLQPVLAYETSHFMKIDYYSKRNLELTETIRSKGKKGSLLWLLDETKTAMGGRMLKQWIDRPLINKKQIERRQSLVETLKSQYFERQDLRERLKEVYDLERLAGRVAFGNVNARDLIQLKRSLQQVPVIREIVKSMASNQDISVLADKLDPCEEVTDLLETALVENPPLSVKEGNIIRDGFHTELDTYRDASRNGKTWIAQLEREERERTGIRSLKIGYNRVFGYYIEVTRANLHLLEEGRYERKQTLTNAERYITPELKEKEALILQAEEKSISLEYDLFLNLREEIKSYIPRLQDLAKGVSELDVLQCFATISEERHYVKPVFSENRRIVLKEGRHPVVEKVLQSQEYVPNDCFMDSERELLLITGPNMSGKSTYMRQIALTSILAQIGCFVSATTAELPIFDKVFTRIGAADDLISGQSTFMVEMLEARNAITNATENSLILFDEIGRGTSTYDGMALAQAIIEYIHEEIGAKTLFSTHYHELTVLASELPKLKNIHVSAIEQNGNVVFLHKIKEGPADKSYGIHVAKLADLPKQLIDRAAAILAQLENENGQAKELPAQPAVVSKEPITETAPKAEVNEAQLSFFREEAPKEKISSSPKEKKVLDDIKSLDILEMTPLDAMNMLYKLQKKLK